jgi:hypothetical protein
VAQLDYQKSVAADNAATAQVGLQTSASVQETNLNDSTVLKQTQDQDAAAQAVAATVSAANSSIAQIQADAAKTIGQSYANAQIQASNNAASASEAQSHAQQQSSIWNTITGIAASALSFFSPASGVPPPTADPNDVFNIANAASDAAATNILVPPVSIVGVGP